MSDNPQESFITDRIEDLRCLTNPRLMSQLVEDATGYLMPTFVAIPPVTILGKERWVQARPGVERFRPGELLSLRPQSDSTSSAVPDTFFTPLCNVDIAPLLLQRVESDSDFEITYRVRASRPFEDTELYCALIPFTTSADSWSDRDVQALLPALEVMRFGLKVTLEKRRKAVNRELVPRWGMGCNAMDPMLDSIVFPANVAKSQLEPLLFRIGLSSSELDMRAGNHRASNEDIAIRFDFSESCLRDLYNRANLGHKPVVGFSIIPNALPVMNLEPVAWKIGESLADHTSKANMKVLGVAGVYPSMVQEKDVPENRLSVSRPPIFSIRVDRTNSALLDYQLAGRSAETGRDEQKGSNETHSLYTWMTRAEAINGAHMEYVEFPKRRNLWHRMSETLRQMRTVVPCFGGMLCGDVHSEDLYQELMLNVTLPPQTFLFESSLVVGIELLLQKLGYSESHVESPKAELRVVGGCRTLAHVVYVEMPGKKIDPIHLRAMEGFLKQRVPLGVELMVEQR